MKIWAMVARLYPGWTLEEIKALTPRERFNWLEIAADMRRAP